MSENQKDKIILKAWNLIQEDTKIKKIFFIPWTISIIFLTIILVYQAIYTYVVLLNKKEEVLVVLLNFLHSNYFVEIIILALIFLIIYIIIIPIFDWWLIYYIDKKNNWESISGSELIWWWVYRFPPFFEYSNLFSQLKFISLINTYLFCLRFVWINYMWLLNYIFFFLLIFSVILNILFAYSKFEIVLNNKKALDSVAWSIKISLYNLWTTIRLYFFLFIVNIRIILNFFVFLFFPIIIVAALTYITSKIFLAITITILTIVFIIFILLLWYLWGVFEVFKTSVWYYAYIYWKERVKDVKDDNDDDDN